MTTSTLRSLALGAAATAVSLTLAAPHTDAQCFGDDNLDNGGCCDQTVVQLPDFPQVQMPGLGVCWDNCDVFDQNEIFVEWQPLQQTVCGQYKSILRVIDATFGVTLMTGEMTLDYSRTWLEFDPTGGVHQVWRFVAKADMTANPGPVIQPLCPVPPILSQVPNGIAFFYGYMDYVDCPATPGTQPPRNALVLYHACDRFIHTPGFSSQPGVFNPEQSYAIVAPHTAAQPFIPANQIAPGGPIVQGATRNVSVSPQVCNVEDRVLDGSIDALAAGCVCVLQKNPKQQTLRDFRAVTSCPSPVGLNGNWDSQAFGFPNTLPWFEMVTTSIGFWASPFAYPGEESAWVDEGLFIHEDVCTGSFIEVKYGGTTAKGWDAMDFNGVGLGSFTDIADNWSAPLFGPYFLPIFGDTQPTDRVIHVNLP